MASKIARAWPAALSFGAPPWTARSRGIEGACPLPLCLAHASWLLLERAALSRAVIEAIKKQLEGRMRLAAKDYVRAEQQHFAFSQAGFGDGRSAIQVLLTPSPATDQRFVAGEPGNGIGPFRGSVR